MKCKENLDKPIGAIILGLFFSIVGTGEDE